METRNIAEDEIVALSVWNQYHVFDRKSLGINRKNTQSIAVARANVDGGEFVAGIGDDTDETESSMGWQEIKKLEDLLQPLFNLKKRINKRSNGRALRQNNQAPEENQDEYNG